MHCPAQLTPFNSDTGKQAAIRSAEVRRIIFQTRQDEAKADRASRLAQHQTLSAIDRQLRLTLEQIARTRSILKGEDIEPKARASLLRELRGLMEHECRLRGIGEPGRLKPVNQPAAAKRAEPTPCVPSTTIASVPERQPMDNAPQLSQVPKV